MPDPGDRLFWPVAGRRQLGHLAANRAPGRPVIEPLTPGPAAQATSASAPTATVEIRRYTVQAGDTLWDIAIASRVAIDVLVAANPGLNPNALQAGQEVLIPISPEGTSAPVQVAAQTLQGDSIQLRRGPSAALASVAALPGRSPVTVIGRSDDNSWLEVTIPDGQTGWVMAQWVALPGAVADLPVTWRMITFVTPTPGGAALPTLAPAPNYRYLFGIGRPFAKPSCAGSSWATGRMCFPKSATASP